VHSLFLHFDSFLLIARLILDDAHAARRRYKKDLDVIKPDLAAYNKQKELALGLAPGALASGSGSTALTQFDASGSSVSIAASIHSTGWSNFFLVNTDPRATTRC
jgi:pre-mRNA-splicing factor SYF2